MRPLRCISAFSRSIWSRACGTHAVPCSVNTTVMPGKRSNTPDMVRCHSARFDQNAASITNITTDDAHLREPRHAGAAGVVRDRDVALLADLPDRVVRRREQRLDPGRVGRDAREQHAAEAVLVAPDDVVDRFVDVVQEDLRLPGAAPGRLRTEVGEPAVVGPDAGEAGGEVLGRRGRRDHRAGREERRAPCSGTRPRPRRLRRPVRRCAGRCPSCARARRPGGRGTGSSTWRARRRTRRATPDRGTRGTARAIRPRGSRPR